MNNRVTGRFAIKTLEFDKVKMRAAEKAATELGKDKLLTDCWLWASLRILKP